MTNELTEPRSQDDPHQTCPSLSSVCFTCLQCKTTMFHWVGCFLVIIYSCRKDGASKEWARSQKFIAEAECGNVWVILQSDFQFVPCSARSCVKIVQCWTYTQTVSKKPQMQPYLACPSLHPECYWLLMCSTLEDLPRQSIKSQNETTYKMLTRGISRTKLTGCLFQNSSREKSCKCPSPGISECATLPDARLKYNSSIATYHISCDFISVSYSETLPLFTVVAAKEINPSSPSDVKDWILP